MGRRSKAYGLQPHRCRQFKLSTDPQFVAKLRDVVGIYFDPPAHALVLSVAEKSKIRALDRTQPGLPLKKGRLGTMTHDHKRHGTTTLFAALNGVVRAGHPLPRPCVRGIAEEAPGTYKDVRAVVDAGAAAGLANKVAILSPIICVKG
jgi:hypothetical protein